MTSCSFIVAGDFANWHESVISGHRDSSAELGERPEKTNMQSGDVCKRSELLSLVCALQIRLLQTHISFKGVIQPQNVFGAYVSQVCVVLLLI